MTAASRAWPPALLVISVSSASLLSGAACSTAGNVWVSEQTADDASPLEPSRVRAPAESGAAPDPSRFRTRTIGGEEEEARVEARRGDAPKGPIAGKVLGTFRNTYYDFPTEADFGGEALSLRDAKCGAIASVPRAFYEAVCVQGSGILKTGRTVSFAKRDCDCAEVCPRTGQKICFEALEPLKFPWGRGAMGTPITPLLTVAVDDTLVPMGTALYIPEFDGLPVDAARSAVHDGCFIAQDRGLRVKGEHVDVFTGYSAITELWNHLVPTNHGVTVVVDSPRCARAPQ